MKKESKTNANSKWEIRFWVELKINFPQISWRKPDFTSINIAKEHDVIVGSA